MPQVVQANRRQPGLYGQLLELLGDIVGVHWPAGGAVKTVAHSAHPLQTRPVGTRVMIRWAFGYRKG
ncbi:hypothetical protein ACQPZP_04395 [Spirillospora sp. CA-142024]|uniref:hypothetical protein n=1 Tax=Spirillospora sp. CA-142024 TaxID=3240036 RepID=UPI003D9034B6